MRNNESLAYDLALIYAKTKFDAANKNGIISSISPNNEPETELKALATFFNDAYNWYISHDPRELTNL